MKKQILISSLLILIIVIVSFSVYIDVAQIKKVCIQKNCFNVQIADNDIEREKGLMNITSLPNSEGMLFVFDKPDKYTFWMEDTLIPLDIIWISDKKEIVAIKADALPCTENCSLFTPKFNSTYVLEINAKLSEQLGINVGDLVKFK